jgi:hypothetical protein
MIRYYKTLKFLPQGRIYPAVQAEHGGGREWCLESATQKYQRLRQARGCHYISLCKNCLILLKEVRTGCSGILTYKFTWLSGWNKNHTSTNSFSSMNHRMKYHSVVFTYLVKPNISSQCTYWIEIRILNISAQKVQELVPNLLSWFYAFSFFIQGFFVLAYFVPRRIFFRGEREWKRGWTFETKLQSSYLLLRS